MSNRVLIYGSGFISRHVCNEFTSNGDEIYVLYHNHKLEDFSGHQSQFKNDLLSHLHSFKPNYILFAKGNSYVSHNTNIDSSIQDNVQPTASALDVIHQNIGSLPFLNKIIIIGSAAEYEKKIGPLKETDPLNPTTIYGLSKILLYNIAQYYQHLGLPIIYTRQFNAIGPWQRDMFVLSSFSSRIAKIENGATPSLEVGDLACGRDFIDVRDAARAYRTLFIEGKAGETYNVGSGVCTRIQDLLNTLLENTAYKNKISVSAKAGTSAVEGLNNILLSDSSKLYSLGYNPIFKIEETVVDTLNFWRKHV